MVKKVKISAVQMQVLSARKNLPKILLYMKKASSDGSDIVCFPEGSLNPNYKKPFVEADLASIQKECKKLNILVVINGYFRNKKNDVYNRTYVIDNLGKILGFYDKIYLWKTELNIKRGNSIKVINTSFGKIGLCTCWDLFFPDMIKRLKDKGAEIIICPSYWNDNLKKESQFLESAPIVYSYLHMVFFVYCNALFKGKTAVSQITAPWGILNSIKYKEGIISAHLFIGRLIRFKKHFKSVYWDRKV